MRRLNLISAIFFTVMIVLALLLLPRGPRDYKKGQLPSPGAVIKPQKQYVLELWDYRYPVRWQGTGNYEDFLKFLLAEFNKLYPNVTVKYTILSRLDGPQKLARAFQEGTPPDVYGGPPELDHIESGMVIPAGPYLSMQEKAAYEPAVLNLLTFRNQLWAWPRSLSFTTWAGNRGLLEDAGVSIETVQKEGWDWNKFLEIATRLKMKSKDGRKKYALAVEDEAEFLQQLMAGKGRPVPFSATGNPLWQGSQLKETLDLWKKLIEMGVLAPRNEGPDSHLLELFWSGNVAVINHAGPWLVLNQQHREDHMKRKELASDDTFVQPALLPIPHWQGEQEYVFPVIEAYTVFRQANYKGDDHSRVAIELARFLSRGLGSWLAVELQAIPPYKPDQEYWQDKDYLKGPLGQFLKRNLSYPMNFSYISLEQKAREAKFKDEARLILKDIWSAKSSVEQLAVRIGEIMP